MKMNKQTIEYINSLVEDKAKKKLAELEAKRDAITKKEEAVISAAKSDVDKVLADAAKKVEAIYRKYGIAPMDWCDKITKVGVKVCDEVRKLRSEFADELESANDAINSFGCVVYKKQTEVVAKLSLGGTAEDLDKIIGEIEF